MTQTIVTTTTVAIRGTVHDGVCRAPAIVVCAQPLGARCLEDPQGSRHRQAPRGRCADGRDDRFGLLAVRARYGAEEANKSCRSAQPQTFPIGFCAPITFPMLAQTGRLMRGIFTCATLASLPWVLSWPSCR